MDLIDINQYIMQSYCSLYCCFSCLCGIVWSKCCRLIFVGQPAGQVPLKIMTIFACNCYRASEQQSYAKCNAAMAFCSSVRLSHAGVLCWSEVTLFFTACLNAGMLLFCQQIWNCIFRVQLTCGVWAYGKKLRFWTQMRLYLLQTTNRGCRAQSFYLKKSKFFRKRVFVFCKFYFVILPTRSGNCILIFTPLESSLRVRSNCVFLKLLI